MEDDDDEEEKMTTGNKLKIQMDDTFTFILHPTLHLFLPFFSHSLVGYKNVTFIL